jgi:hypothetical protein
MSPKLGFVTPALALAVDGHARPMATNKPVGDNARKGSVELDNPLTKTKRVERTAVKKTAKKF